jgi:hypothetical protein
MQIVSYLDVICRLIEITNEKLIRSIVMHIQAIRNERSEIAAITAKARRETGLPGLPRGLQNLGQICQSMFRIKALSFGATATYVIIATQTRRAGCLGVHCDSRCFAREG